VTDPASSRRRIARRARGTAHGNLYLSRLRRAQLELSMVGRLAFGGLVGSLPLLFTGDTDGAGRAGVRLGNPCRRARALPCPVHGAGHDPGRGSGHPRFVVNRLLFPYLFSAVELLDSTGMQPAEVDQCMTLGAGMPMGPIALLGYVGLDVSQAIGETIGSTVPERLRELVDAGALERKSGRGFYTYD
jgi:hypothetical protein